MKIHLYFDMDGTLYDLYNIPGWRYRLNDEDPRVFCDDFMDRTTLFFQSTRIILNRGEREKFSVDVITWMPMGASEDFCDGCIREKNRWLSQKSFQIENLFALPYGQDKHDAIPKCEINTNDIYVLIDDDKNARRMWEYHGLNFWSINPENRENAIHELEKLIDS